MKHRTAPRTRWTAGLAAASLVIAGLVLVSPGAQAAPAPVAQRTTAAVTADVLPTVQVDGVVWSQVIVGNTVYAGGSFATARPAGAAPGVNTTPRTNLLAYNLSTGALITTFAPTLNGQVLSVAASPDGSRLYVGGDFTSVNGATANRLVALNPATGATISAFATNLDYRVKTIVATAATVYVGGGFSTANGVARGKLAAFTAATGALTTWNPTSNDVVNTLVMVPDGSRLIAGGVFTTMAGSTAYGLASLDATTASLLPWGMNAIVKNAGANAAITSLSTDGTAVYGTGYTFGAGGNFEGLFSADPNSGNINWMEDCHGDSYGAFSNGSAAYIVSHSHYCSGVGAFPETDTRTWHRALAYTTSVQGTLAKNRMSGYADFSGQPSPAQINWYPDLTAGTFTGQDQAAWTVTGNSQYILLGGEFPSVNGTPQQGLVRFAVPAVAPSLQGPMVPGSKFLPTVTTLTAGTARVAFLANWDRDDKTLSYQVVRDGNVAAPVYSTTADSTFWRRPSLGFTDTGLQAGYTYRYRLYVTDSSGNQVVGDSFYYTVPSTVSLSSYGAKIISDGAADLWPLNETSGTAFNDAAGYTALVTSPTGVTLGTQGPLAGDTAATFDGTAGSAYTPSSVEGPDTFSASAWFRTTTTTGGKILGFGSAQTTLSKVNDRNIYLDNTGKIYFGVASNQTLASTAAYNDGLWHQVSVSLGAAGMSLYVDGLRVAKRTDVTAGTAITGYWRIGGDSLAGWANKPASNFFKGSIADVAIHPTELTGRVVQDEFIASGRASTAPSRPTDAYGSNVYQADPDLYWRLAEAGGATAASAGIYPNAADYVGGVTLGAAGALSGNPDTAATFNGSNGFVVGRNAVINPNVFTESAWFRTTTTRGGKIIGLGNARTGTSAAYDRHVYMDNTGRLVFGVYSGVRYTLTTPTALNDGKWHQVVASMSSVGMRLYVDGNLVGSNSQAAGQNFTGYWRVGGDATWGSTSNYFAGSIDEAAVYYTALNQSQVTAQYSLGTTGLLPNVLPTASFTTAATDLTVSASAAASADPDGSIASYAWTFGDGAVGTGVSPSHTYTAAGTFTIGLTVTDNRGGTNTTTRAVTVVAPNVLPTAVLTTNPTYLSVAFDGSQSTDSDGSISSYAWTFGDGANATGAMTTHAYATGGTYQATLTVTDNRGGTTTATVTVTVAPPNQPPVASFKSSSSYLVTGLDGSASSDPDGSIASYAWNFGDSTTGVGSTTTHAFAADGTYLVSLTVTDNQGAAVTTSQSVTVMANRPPVASIVSSVTGLLTSVNGSSSADLDGSVASWSWNFGDGATATGALASHKYATGGTYQVTLTVTDDQGASSSATAAVTVAAAANQLPVASFTSTATYLALSADGSASFDPDGSVVSYSWNFGDGGTSSTAVASHTYAAAGTYPVALTVTDDQGASTTNTQNVTVVANRPPVSAFVTSANFLTLAADGSTSADPDGPLSAYSWDFGDGTTGTGVGATHSYATPGTYVVALTVTDQGGLTNTSTRTLLVSSGVAADGFNRSVTGGLGSADLGGTWTRSTAATKYSVNGSKAQFAMATAGSTVQAYLAAASGQNVEGVVDVSTDVAPSGSGTYLSIGLRQTGTSEYRLQVRLQPTTTTVQLVKVVSGTETTIKSQTITGLVYNPGDVLRLKFQLSGSGTTSLLGRIWNATATEPTTWQISGTDTEPTLQSAGGVSLRSYISASSTGLPANAFFDNLSVRNLVGGL